MAKNTKYYQLGSKANSFVDPKSGLSIANKQVVSIDADATLGSASISNALNNGHIKEVKEEDFLAFEKEEKARLKNIEKGLPAEEKKAEEKKAGAKKSTPKEEEEDEEDEEEEEEEEEEDEEDEDKADKPLTKTELMELLKKHPKISEADKKNLKNLSLAKLVELQKSLG